MSKIKKIAVVGGAGYIGSFTSHALKNRGYDVVIIDNLSSGHKKAVKGFQLIERDIAKEWGVFDELFKKEKFDAVVHFAALIQVGESMENPGDYFKNNVFGSLGLIEAAARNRVRSFILSSTAAVYGNPHKVPVSEDHQLNPESPYGESKIMAEKILKWYWRIFKLPSASIRYFNAAGAALDGSMGADHPHKTHLITVVVKSILEKKQMTVFGGDYPTPDGTCVRDYIHVLDLADIHIRALEYLEENPGNYVFNAGTGRGYSNLEVIRTTEKETGKNVDYLIGNRRDGDPAIIFADPSLAKKVLGWKPIDSDLKTIIKSAWLWHKNHPGGFS